MAAIVAVAHVVTDTPAMDAAPGCEIRERPVRWLSFDDYRRCPGFTLSASPLGKIIESERGVSVELDE